MRLKTVKIAMEKCPNSTPFQRYTLAAMLFVLHSEFHVVFKSQLYIPFHQRMNPSLNTLTPALTFANAHLMSSRVPRKKNIIKVLSLCDINHTKPKRI